jgi:hypothetical protein
VKQLTETCNVNEIPILKRRLQQHDKVYIYPLCDLHFGEKKAFDEKKFRGYLKIIAEVDEAYCLFNGDLINCGLPGMTGAESFWSQDPLTPQEQNDCLVDLVREYDIKDKILAIVGGSNHPARAKKLTGHDYDKQFAQMLGLEHLYKEPLCILFLGVGARKTATSTHHKGTSVWYSIVTTHGWAGGRQAGSSINSIRELGAVYGADCLITSHRHLDAGSKDEFYVPDYHNKCINKIKRMYVNSGTFMKYTGYAIGKGLRPNGTGTPRIRFDGTKKDVHVSI